MELRNRNLHPALTTFYALSSYSHWKPLLRCLATLSHSPFKLLLPSLAETSCYRDAGLTLCTSAKTFNVWSCNGDHLPNLLPCQCNATEVLGEEDGAMTGDHVQLQHLPTPNYAEHGGTCIPSCRLLAQSMGAHAGKYLFYLAPLQLHTFVVSKKALMPGLLLKSSISLARSGMLVEPSILMEEKCSAALLNQNPHNPSAIILKSTKSVHGLKYNRDVQYAD
eukprot:1159278-Pelagomonas_calceolata.AAC.6